MKARYGDAVCASDSRLTLTVIPHFLSFPSPCVFPASWWCRDGSWSEVKGRLHPMPCHAMPNHAQPLTLSNPCFSSSTAADRDRGTVGQKWIGIAFAPWLGLVWFGTGLVWLRGGWIARTGEWDAAIVLFLSLVMRWKTKTKAGIGSGKGNGLDWIGLERSTYS